MTPPMKFPVVPQVSRLSFPLSAAILAVLAWAAPCLALTLYVGPEGNDAWSGTLDAPNATKTDGCFATLGRARNEIRKLRKTQGLPAGGIVVEIRGGVYPQTANLLLEPEDSGTESAPIVWQARAGEVVRITGGVEVTGFKPVTDPEVLKRIDEAARPQVLQADLNALGVKKLGSAVGPDDENHDRLELFFQDKVMTLARWPNHGSALIKDVDDDQAETAPGGLRVSKAGRIVYEGDRPSRWVHEKDGWLHGCWYWEWNDARQPIESIDAGRHVITIAPPYPAKGYRQGQHYHAFNLLPELDSPGEWYHDRDSGILYFWPPAPLSQGKAVISVAPTLLFMHDLAHVSFRGLIFEACQGTALHLKNVEHVQIIGCTVRNAGRWGIDVRGQNCRIAGCDLSELGYGGIHLTGGDRKTLTPGHLVIDNNHIHHYSRWKRMTKPALKINGVGNVASHNLIDNAPHQALWWTGNDHLIEFNEIHSVCYEANDGGALYAGEDWTERGTVIRHNYLHHLSGLNGGGCLGVYLDDMNSGTEITGNVFYKIENSAKAMKAAVSTCGRDCSITNNVFVDCQPAVEVSTRGQVWFDRLKAKLDQMPYKSELWAGRYPRLVPLLDDEPMLPKGHLIARNICVGGVWSSLANVAKPLVIFENNLVDADPRFVNAAQGDFRLKEDSPAWKLGFKPIPLEKTGPYPSPERASWPLSHTVRPAVVSGGE